MRVVDTSAWIELLLGSGAGAQVRSRLPSRDEWIVPTIVQLELAKWIARERGENGPRAAIALTQMCLVAALDTMTAVAAAEACVSHRLPTADAIIYATALEYGGDLLTCDAHFEGLPGVVYVSKKPN